MPGTALAMRSTSSMVKRTSAGLVAAGLLAGAAGEDADVVGAPLGKDGLDGAGEAGAVGEQQHNRGDAPGHADHGDGGAAAIVEHRLPGLSEDVFQHDVQLHELLAILLAVRAFVVFWL